MPLGLGWWGSKIDITSFLYDAAGLALDRRSLPAVPLSRYYRLRYGSSVNDADAFSKRVQHHGDKNISENLVPVSIFRITILRLSCSEIPEGVV